MAVQAKASRKLRLAKAGAHHPVHRFDTAKLDTLALRPYLPIQ